MALIVAVVAFALMTEYLLLQPIRDRLERWREAGLPWGIKR
jgi:NitT/TauT family transport system permease protein